MNILQMFGRKKAEKPGEVRRPKSSTKHNEDRYNTEANEQLVEKHNQEQKGPMRSQVRATHIPTKKSQAVKLQLTRETVVAVLQSSSRVLQEELNLISQYEHDNKAKSAKSVQALAMHYFLLTTQFFRFEQVGHSQCVQNYTKLVEAIASILEKVTAGDSVLNVKGKVFVVDEEDFCEFFRISFGRPSRNFNQKYVRKVLEELWYYLYFGEKNLERVATVLKIWAHGVSLPFNPAKIKVQHAIFRGDIKFVERACKLKLNSPIYCHINEADAMGLTPLMLAVYLKKDSLFSELIVLGANPFLVPVTKMEDPFVFLEDLKQHIAKTKLAEANNLNVKLPIYQRYHRHLIEHLRDSMQMRSMAHLLAMEHARRMYSLNDTSEVARELSEIPDCSFQVAWKIESKFSLLGGAPPSDVITIYKKRGSVRIDFNIINVFSNREKPQRGKYSFLFRDKPELTFVFIDHKARKIVNLYGETEVAEIERRAESFIKEGDRENETISECIAGGKLTKTTYNQTGHKINYSVYYEYENIKKERPCTFDCAQEYEKALINSSLVDYALLSKSELEYIRTETLGEPVKITRKRCQNKLEFEVTTIPYFDLTLEHLHTLLRLVGNSSTVFSRVIKFMQLQKQLFDMGRKSIYPEFPTRAVFDLSLGVSMHVTFQNFNMAPPRNEVFEINHKLESEDFEQEHHPEEHLQRMHERTLSVDSEQLDTSFSRFLTANDKGEEEQFRNACKQYEMLLVETNDSEFIEVISNYSSLNATMNLEEHAQSMKKKTHEEQTHPDRLNFRR